MNYKIATQECTKVGGEIFRPDDINEYESIQELGNQKALGNYLFKRNFFWIGYKLKNPSARNCPPVLGVTGSTATAPGWTGTRKMKTLIWDRKECALIKRGRGGKLIVSKGGKWYTKKQGKRSQFAAICERAKAATEVDDPTRCWQPTSSIFDRTEYTGTISRTGQGYTCMSWDGHDGPNTPDAKIQQLVAANQTKFANNYCRNPDNDSGGPWCYTTDANQKWDTCGQIPLCHTPKNEFDRDQAACGTRPLIASAGARVINGRDTLPGETPYQVRLRTAQAQNLGGVRTTHKCGATLISSCWAATAAHCIETEDYFEDRGGAKTQYRVEVGTRYARIENDQGDAEIDNENYQTIYVESVHVHQLYSNNANDIALIRFSPTRDDGTCADFGDTVQPACIENPDKSVLFNTGDTCMVSGWGDTNNQEAKIQHAPVLQIVDLALVGFEDCAAKWLIQRNILKEQIHMCAMKPGSDSCRGDSGGPLVCQSNSVSNTTTLSYLSGIVSFGDATCNTGDNQLPGIYVPVKKYYHWIRNTIFQQTKENPAPDVRVCADHDCRN